NIEYHSEINRIPDVLAGSKFLIGANVITWIYPDTEGTIIICDQTITMAFNFDNALCDAMYMEMRNGLTYPMIGWWSQCLNSVLSLLTNMYPHMNEKMMSGFCWMISLKGIIAS
ncbi:MAG: hypothetical protein ACJATI_003412, partial [Halioglobus sp.]